MLAENLSVAELTEVWLDANDHSCCSCHVNPPCEFCVNCFSLPLEDFLDAHGCITAEFEEPHVDAYDRAMKSVI